MTTAETGGMSRSNRGPGGTATALLQKIRRQVGRAIGDFQLIEAGDRIAVGVSGGKDSYTLLQLLQMMRRRSPIPYELVAVNVDAGFAGYRSEVIEDYLRRHDFNYKMKKTASAAVIDAKLRPGSSYCAFCARLRRGVLYALADELHCNKIALGHHLDDVIETLLLNQFFDGRLAAMSPKLLADNRRHTVIRPLVYVDEATIIEFAKEQKFPLVDCGCPLQDAAKQQRQRIKRLLEELSVEIPDLRRSLIKACANVDPRHLLDRVLKSF